MPFRTKKKIFCGIGLSISKLVLTPASVNALRGTTQLVYSTPYCLAISATPRCGSHRLVLIWLAIIPSRFMRGIWFGRGAPSPWSKAWRFARICSRVKPARLLAASIASI